MKVLYKFSFYFIEYKSIHVHPKCPHMPTFFIDWFLALMPKVASSNDYKKDCTKIFKYLVNINHLKF